MARAIDFPERGLAHPGRADEAQDGALQVLLQRPHRQVLHDAVLHLLQVVVVLVQDLLGQDHVQLVLGLLCPGKVDQPVQVGAGDRVLGGLGRHLPQPVQLLLGDLARFLRHARALDLLAQFVQLSPVVLLAELLLDGLHLLAQIELALGLPHLVRHLRLDAAADLLQLHLAGDDLHQLLDAILDVVPLQEADLLLHGDVEHGGGQVGQAAGIAGAGGQHHVAQVVGDGGRDLHQALELVDEGLDQRLQLHPQLARLVQGGHGRLDEWLAGGEAVHAQARQPLDDQVDVVAVELDHLEDAGRRAHAVHAGRVGVVLGGVPLRDHADELVVAHHVVQQVQRLPATHRDRHDGVREEHAVAEGKNSDLAGYLDVFHRLPVSFR
jgi:hypothetical protein